MLTSAGAASGIDLCLHILRRDLGVAASNHAARRLVAAPYRSGGQAQYVPRSVPEPLGERFAATREWALHQLGEPLTLEALAQHAGVSARTFSRRFAEDTGYTPMQWVMRARIDVARELLERSSAVSNRSRTMSASAPAPISACTSTASWAPPRPSTGAPSPRASSPGPSRGEILTNHGDLAAVADGDRKRT